MSEILTFAKARKAENVRDSSQTSYVSLSRLTAEYDLESTYPTMSLDLV